MMVDFMIDQLRNTIIHSNIQAQKASHRDVRSLWVKNRCFFYAMGKSGQSVFKKERLSPSFRVETAPRIKKNPD
jgi:hypothetical protein